MTHTLIPRSSACSAKVVSSLDFEKYWSCDILNEYVKCGYTVTAQCPAALAADISAGVARVKGLYVENTIADCVSGLTACSCNYIYLTVSRDVCCRPSAWVYSTNTTGCTPTDSTPIAIATTNATTVTSVCSNVAEVCSGVRGSPACQIISCHSTCLCDYIQPGNAVGSSEACIARTFTDNFCTDNWIDSCSCNIGVNTVCSRLDFNDCTNGTADLSHVNMLGTTTSDTDWTLRFKLCLTTLTARTSSSAQLIVGLFDTTALSTANQDGIYLKVVQAAAVTFRA